MEAINRGYKDKFRGRFKNSWLLQIQTGLQLHNVKMVNKSPYKLNASYYLCNAFI